MRRQTKLGAIFLIAIMALAGSGIAYSAWTDTLHIVGNVSTGSVEWHFTDDSGMWVYKDLVTDDIVILTEPSDNQDYYLVAWSYAEIDETDDTDHSAIVEFQNIFPLDGETPGDTTDDCWEADLTIEYTGTIPGKINDFAFEDVTDVDPTEGVNTGIWGDTDDEALLDQITSLDITLTRASDPQNPVTIPLADLWCLQLHEGDQLHVIMKICVPEEDQYEGLTGYFNVDVEVIQWNEAACTPG